MRRMPFSDKAKYKNRGSRENDRTANSEYVVIPNDCHLLSKECKDKQKIKHRSAIILIAVSYTVNKDICSFPPLQIV